MRIVLMSDQPVTPRDALTGLADALTRQGHDVTVSADRSTPDRSRRKPPNVIHTHGHAEATTAVTPVVHTFHRRSEIPTHGLGRDVDRFVVTCAAHVLPLIRAGAPRTHITVIPPGVDTEQFVPEGPAAPVKRRPRLLFAGPVTAESGCVDSLVALRAVPDAELVVVTDSPTATLLDLARRVGVAERVRPTARRANQDMARLLRSTDVVLCTPRAEPVDRIALEAMACGVPVIATAVGHLADVVVDGITGLLVPPRRHELTRALRRLANDRVSREQWGAVARDRACARYSWTRIATEHERLYTSATTERESVRQPSRAGTA